jgi:hypothetical protein
MKIYYRTAVVSSHWAFTADQEAGIPRNDTPLGITNRWELMKELGREIFRNLEISFA